VPISRAEGLEYGHVLLLHQGFADAQASGNLSIGFSINEHVENRPLSVGQ
jgi:hypothetical protein